MSVSRTSIHRSVLTLLKGQANGCLVCHWHKVNFIRLLKNVNLFKINKQTKKTQTLYFFFDHQTESWNRSNHPLTVGQKIKKYRTSLSEGKPVGKPLSLTLTV